MNTKPDTLKHYQREAREAQQAALLPQAVRTLAVLVQLAEAKDLHLHSPTWAGVLNDARTVLARAKELLP